MSKNARIGGGTRKGIPNKSTVEIKEIIHKAVDFHALVKKLAERAEKGSDRAAVILFEFSEGCQIHIEH